MSSLFTGADHFMGGLATGKLPVKRHLPNLKRIIKAGVHSSKKQHNEAEGKGLRLADVQELRRDWHGQDYRQPPCV